MSISILFSVTLYVAISLLNRKKPLNMDRMLHRGKYQLEGKKIEHGIKNARDFFLKIIGINDVQIVPDILRAFSESYFHSNHIEEELLQKGFELVRW